MRKKEPFRGEPRWQKEQKERKNKKQRLAVGYWLLLVGLLVFGGLVFKIWQMTQKSQWDGSSRINFVMADEKVSLVSLNPQEQELLFLSFPSGTQLEVTHGFGKYRLEAILRLEEIEKQKGLLAESLGENLGVVVEGWMESKVQSPKSKVNKEELLGELQRQIQGQGETNLTKWDLIRLWWEVRKIRIDKTKLIDLGKIDVLEEATLPDEEKVWEIDKVRFDAKIGKLFSDSQIKEEKLTFEILNGTSHPGLAQQAARMMTNLGGEVVWVGDSEVKSQKSKVKSQKSKKNSYTVKKILKIFNCQGEEKEEEGRGEITLILGEDYWQKLNQK